MYFQWTEKPFVTPRDLKGTPSDPDVVIVGAGPVGLAAGIGFAQRGLRTIILEKRNTVSDGSRAIGFHLNSMQLFDRLGIGDEFREMCHVRPYNWLYIDGEIFAETKYSIPANEKHPQQGILQQCWVEEMLVKRAEALPGLEIRWLSEVRGVTQDDGGVTLSVRTEEGDYSLTSPYVVATDGARGTVRRELGMTWESPVSPLVSDRSFVIVDFELDTDLSPGRRLYLDLPYDPGASTLFHYQPFGVWRLDYPLSGDQDPELEVQPEQVEKRVRQHLDMMGEHQPFNIVWTSTYRARARTLSHYVNGRVIFAGDAAHQTPIFGGRGLNSGFADVANLMWRLPRVVRGEDGPESLERYSQERKQVLVDTLKALTQVTMFMTQPTEGVRFVRRAALDLAWSEPFVRDLVDGHSAIKTEAYATTPGVHPSVGRPLPESNLVCGGAADQRTFLRDQLGSAFTLIQYAPIDGQADRASVGDLADVTLLTIHARSAGDGTLADENGNLARALDLTPGCSLLVRPDGYVAARWDMPVGADAVVTAIASHTSLQSDTAVGPIATKTAAQRMFLALSELADRHGPEALAIELSKALLVVADRGVGTDIVDFVEELASVDQPAECSPRNPDPIAATA